MRTMGAVNKTDLTITSTTLWGILDLLKVEENRQELERHLGDFESKPMFWEATILRAISLTLAVSAIYADQGIVQ